MKLLCFFAALGCAAAANAGTLSLDRGSYEIGDTITATYTTDQPGDLNWLGVYRQPGNGPVNGVYVGPSIVWTYAPTASGTKTLATSTLTPGRHVMYFLLNDGYVSTATPVEFDVVPRQTDTSLAFLAGAIAERNARVGDAYAGSVRGAARAPAAATLTYAKNGGPAWLAVAANGDLSGTPGEADIGDNAFALTVSDGTGASASASLAIRVRAAGEPVVDTLRVMSFNAWQGGSRVDAARDKQRRIVFAQNADVVGIQEDAGTAQALATALGWSHRTLGGLAILSRYPIVGEARADFGGGPIALGVRVRVAEAPPQEIVVWTTQLAYSPYGPYDACFGGYQAADLVRRENESGRVAAIDATLAAMQPQIADRALTDVVLTGDFNAPSHLDWTEATSAQHCNAGAVAWPATRAVENAGLADTYRAVHPDAAAQAGNTWSPIYPQHGGASGKDEPQDRIDYVFHAGDDWRAAASESVVIGTPAAYPNVAANVWPSDHAAVVTTFDYVATGDAVFVDGFEDVARLEE
ncbi:endonuclease/exonuclease/phosphatase family protein [Tahibacter soli]|uniref:Endonuclease/exonuclease/phosphatase family protein n=1 Tax=Tahibacter soli TaxID=2983605 RepID=A0A9X4BJE4_9GAMM|nr:endonuclease/exonuclease/phosphatase family protein [Tahibacter soli]MDC8014548.1 endonuclease/exonuclease/phosphatase family protein [Tahibacter soli]